jgi:hypothetical protein
VTIQNLVRTTKMSVPNQPLPIIVILNSSILTNIPTFNLSFKIFPDKSKSLWCTAMLDPTLFCAYFAAMFSKSSNYSILLGLTCLIVGKLLSHVLFCAVCISTKRRIPQYSCFSINPMYKTFFFFLQMTSCYVIKLNGNK